MSALSGPAHALVVRLLAENFPRARVLAEIHRQFPEHRPSGSSPVTYSAVRNIEERRQSEITELRHRLNESLDDVWISTKRARLVELANIYREAAKPRATRVVRTRSGAEELVREPAYDVMLKTLAQAREELGEDADSRRAATLEQLVALAELERGLPLSASIDVTPANEPALLAEVPERFPANAADTGD